VAAAGTVWVGTTDGLLRYDPRADRFVPVTELVEVRRLAPGDLGLWVIARGAVFEVVAGGARPFLRAHPALDLAPVEGAVWLGTEDGLERLLTRGERSGEVEDVLGTGDAGVAVPAVADDGAGGCWFAAADGTVGRVAADGRRGAIRLPGAEPPRPSRLVPFGDDQAWVLTAAGTWLVRVRLGDRSVTGAVTEPVTGFEAEP
jgi:ligand-binding sensor domain-containing protein